MIDWKFKHRRLLGMTLMGMMLLAIAIAPAAVAQEGQASRRGETGDRRTSENGRSAEAERGSQRSAEAEAGRRRSPEADQRSRDGDRRSRERDRDRSDAVERERGPADAPEKRGSREPIRDRAQAPKADGFRPQSDREAALYQMVLQLQREVAALRREIEAVRSGSSSESGNRRTLRDRREGDARSRPDARSDADGRRSIRRDGDGERREGIGPRDRSYPRDGELRGDRDRRDSDTRRESTDRDRRGSDLGEFRLPPRWQSTKAGKVFAAYDKNADGMVKLDEWLAMTNGNINAERRALQTQRFRAAEPGGDGAFTPTEFIWWYTIGRNRDVERD